MEIIDIEKELKNVVVIKRNNRRVEFDGKKIAIAIKKAFESVEDEKYSEKDANKVYIAVLKELYDKYIVGNVEEGLPKVKIETIQDVVIEKLRILKYMKVYENYTTYRENRLKIRTAFEERKKYKFLSIIDKLDVEEILESEEEKTPTMKLEELGEEIAKHYAESQIIKKKYMDAHEEGNIYIHDMKALAAGQTGTTQLDLSNIYREGIETKNTVLRNANSIMAYANIACNIMFLTAKEQYYGESFPYFDYMMAKGVLRTFKKQFKEILYDLLEFTEHKSFLPMNSILREMEKIETIEFDIQIFRQYLRGSEKVFEIFKKAKQLAIRNTEIETKQAMDAFVHNLNTFALSSADKKIYSVNLGTDISPEGRLITKTLFEVMNKGIGTGRKPKYPEIVFKIKEKINFSKNSPNYDIFIESLRLNLDKIKYSFMDTSYNNLGTEPNTEAGYINGIRTIENLLDDKREIVTGRGLIAVVSVNLVGIAIKEVVENKKFNKKKFFARLDQAMAAAKQVLADRFEELSLRSRNNYPYLFGHELWLESDKIKEEDKLRRALKHGILAIGFNGLHEMLLVKNKKTKLEKIEEEKEFALEVVKYMRKKCDKYSEENTLNYQLIGLPEDYDSNMFLDVDLTINGKVPGVTDKNKYTNSFKLPVLKHYYSNIEDQIKWEGSFHKYTNAGHTFVLNIEKEKSEEEIISYFQTMRKNLIGFVELNKI